MAPSPTDTDERTETPFSTHIREATMRAHRDAERAEYVHRLMRGQLPLDGVIDLMAQHHAIYSVLERTGDLLRDDPIVGEFVGDELRRVPRIEADLAHLAGADWSERFVTRPSTSAYAGTIAATVRHPERFVAQHYTRLLGDLSGGQAIRRTLERHYGDGIAGGLTFYHFEIDDMDVYKDRYRSLLDHAPWSDAEREAFLDETRLAYRSNSAMFAELGDVWNHL